MIRVSILAASVVCLLACNNASDDDKKAKTAQAEANDQSGAAMKEAAEKVHLAQGQANEKISAARTDFKTMCEDYRHTTANNLIALDQKVDALTTQANQATGKEKVDRDANLKQIRSSREAFSVDYRALDSASEGTWDITKTRVEKEWAELKALVDRA